MVKSIFIIIPIVESLLLPMKYTFAIISVGEGGNRDVVVAKRNRGY